MKTIGSLDGSASIAIKINAGEVMGSDNGFGLVLKLRTFCSSPKISKICLNSVETPTKAFW